MVLTRVNSITKVEYRNDPTILGWELINEPRCTYDSCSTALQVRKCIDFTDRIHALVRDSLCKNRNVGLTLFQP